MDKSFSQKYLIIRDVPSLSDTYLVNEWHVLCPQVCTKSQLYTSTYNF